MTCLYLTEEDVEKLVAMPLAIEAVEEAFRNLASGRAANVPRVRTRARGIVLHSMIASAEYLGLVGWKQYTTCRAGARFLVGLYDQHDGALVALIDANRLGQIRTGAVTGIAARYLAKDEAQEVGILGSGWQAEGQLAALASTRPIRRAVVFSRDTEKRAAFARRMSEQLRIEVIPVDDAHQAVADLPIVVTATTSRDPVLDASWLAPGTLVCAMGSNWPDKAELDVRAVAAAACVVCDSVDCCRHEAGELIQAAGVGVFDWSQAVELADVVAGKADGRPGPESIVLMKSVGMAIEDVALGARLIELARQQRVGQELPL